MMAAVVIVVMGASLARASGNSSEKGGGEKGKGEKAKAMAMAMGRELVRPKGPPSLVLEWVDMDAGRAGVRVGGVAKAPHARLFAFHDERDRHFIALEAHCEPASLAGEPLPPGVVVDRTDKNEKSEGGDHKDKGADQKDKGADQKDKAADKGGNKGERGDKGDKSLPEDDLRCELELPRHYLQQARELKRVTVHIKDHDVLADDAEVAARFAFARARHAERLPADDPFFLRAQPVGSRPIVAPPVEDVEDEDAEEGAPSGTAAP